MRPITFNRRHSVLTVAAVAAIAWLATPVQSAGADDGFADWVGDLRAEALERGIAAEIVGTALAEVSPIPEILELDRRQPGAPSDFCGYMDRRLTPTRIARARAVMTTHRDLLRDVTARYGVPARYLVALWGLETNFGDYVGSYPVVGALVTLAYDTRRSELFREQIFAALRILEEGHLDPTEFVGSWAGASGQMQFMPTTFLAYAVDYDGDGRKNIWTSTPDALATAANYLRQSGWRGGETWGRQVTLPENLEAASAELQRHQPIATWRERGVRRFDGGDLPAAGLHGSIVVPRRESEPAYLVYPNYRTFLSWNRSTFFAISVGTLADAAAGADTSPTCGS